MPHLFGGPNASGAGSTTLHAGRTVKDGRLEEFAMPRLRATWIKQGPHQGQVCTILERRGKKSLIRLRDGSEVEISSRLLWKHGEAQPPRTVGSVQSDAGSSVRTVSGGLPTLNKRKK